MRKTVIVMSLMAFAFFAGAQASTTRQATPVMKVDAASSSTTTAATDGNTEKKACCEKGAQQGKACCKDGAKGECKHHGTKSKGKSKEETKACCQKGNAQGCAHGAETKSCSHGTTPPAKACPHSEDKKQ